MNTRELLSYVSQTEAGNFEAGSQVKTKKERKKKLETDRPRTTKSLGRKNGRGKSKTNVFQTNGVFVLLVSYPDLHGD